MFKLSKSKYVNFSALYRTADDFIGRLPRVKQRRRLRRVFKILKISAAAAGFLLILLMLLVSTQIFSLKRIYNQAMTGKNQLEQAVNLIKKNDFSSAAELARAAENNFTQGRAALNQLKENYFLSRLPWALSQLNELESLLAAARFLSKAAGQGAALGQDARALLAGGNNLNFSGLKAEEKRKILNRIYESAPELNGIKADLDLAFLNFGQIKARGVLAPFAGKINQLAGRLNEARLIMAQAAPMSQLIPALAGYPNQAVFLIMLENNDELRPSGGFLGTYGILQTKDGDITELYTDDIYHLDMPAQDHMNVEPPAPIKKYLNQRWYLRDANWSPDWPAAARQIEWFYQLESRLNPEAKKVSGFDGVIAMTPKLIMDLLAFTGPVTIEGQTYDQNNFQELLQYRVEKGYEQLGVPKWQRKQVIGQITKELKKKIFSLPAGDWPGLIMALADNLAKKDLMLFLADPQLEKIAVQSGWAGEIKNYGGDYLMVVDANFGALKTDAAMNRGLDYSLAQGANGFFSRLTLNYAHNGRPDWRTTTYKSYTRIYVPLGSELISISGYAPGQVDTGIELNKAWFGFYLTVDPGKIKQIEVKYRLPGAVFTAGGYSLYLQKQAGKEIGQAKVDLSFDNKIKSYSPNSLSIQKVGANRVKWEGELDIDRSFEINF